MRLPAEWEPHERTLMGWPCRRELWDESIGQAREDYASVANAIAAFEPVTMIANPGEDARQAREACSAAVEIVELPLDDSWLRDCGPIYVRMDDERRAGIHFGFNAWGERFHPYDRDAEVGALIARRLGDEVRTAPMVLEGGSITCDGAGTLLTTEQCLLNPNRNASLSREQIESILLEQFGLDRIVWLGQGLIEDRDTDGHVDLIAAFSDERRTLLQTVGPDNPNYADAGIDVIEMPHLAYVEVAGEAIGGSYMNLYVCNGAVIVPVFGVPSDEDALAIVAGAYAGREVVPAPGALLAYGGGGPHCITQQVPSRNA